MSPPDALPPDGPAFAAPWQAEVFALTVALNEAGHVDWSDWAARFAARRAEAPRDDAADYYDHWLATLEAVVVDTGLAAAGDITSLAAAWGRAAAATPHGVAVRLENDPERADT